jgi:predicted deacylase
MRSLGSARAAPGEVAVGRLPVGETRDGSAVGLPVAICNGADDGDTLYVQAASDGDELNGVGVLRRLFSDLDPAEVSGTVLAVGVVNVYGFRTAEHRNPIDDTKLNRAYPGDEDGTTSERIAAATFEAASAADYVLDLHQGSTSRMIEETRVRCGRRHRLHEQCLELARVFDAGFVLDQKGPDGQLARVLPDEGVPTVDPELGATVGWDEVSIAQGIEGIYNVLQYYDFLDGECTPTAQIRASDFEQYVAPAGGLVSLECDLGDRVVAGDELFRVTGVFGEEKERVSADVDGIFWRSRRLPQVATGEYVCSVATGIDEC